MSMKTRMRAEVRMKVEGGGLRDEDGHEGGSEDADTG
jgi:hypothetical protein